ncbi:MAG: hypothetical protein H7Z77_07885 [Chitinophagaceae bacterium]|nr:hypothetical protein [Polaromonas sp.]
MKIHLSRTVGFVTLWLAAVAAAIGLAVVAPSESSVMGHVPYFVSHAFQHKLSGTPGEAQPDRTLALITFKRGQGAQADSWINGLNLRNDHSIAWMRMPVLNDPGTDSRRSAIESRLQQSYPQDTEHSKVMPVFTNRSEFLRSAGLEDTSQCYAVVVNRQGDVLARVAGEFDASKAELLRETLTGQR